STTHHVVDSGEESRHNVRRGGFGYGHVMFLRIRNLVDPVSRGDLVSDFDPDYPPLCFACDDARDQDGIVLWCHNGQGMEAPVAAALGKLDAFNLFDPYWCDPEYDIWYRLLNCGIRLPASTGTDWFICSNNRVYVQTEDEFSYDSWLDGLRAGRTFITNGPALFLSVDGVAPGSELPSPVAGKRTPITVTWRSFHPLRQVEVVHNGRVVGAVKPHADGQRDASYSVDVALEGDGWVAARGYGDARDSFGHAVFAHTSPVYVGSGVAPRAAESAGYFVRALDEAVAWVATVGKFTGDAQREEVTELFLRGRAEYAALLRR
ncbi:MAG: CehA/McbA family metallohydrolase, partial [Candidatus Poribacteria bacterium]